MNDIVLTRVKAHAAYVAPRMHNEKKREEFSNAINIIINNLKEDDLNYLLGVGMCKHGGVMFAIEMVEDIITNTQARFGNYKRDANFLLERL